MAKVKHEVNTGDKFGRFIVVSTKTGYRCHTWYHTVKCSCGVVKEVSHASLVLGKSKSCGCMARETTAERAKTHGMSKSPEYATWNRMWNRCTNPIVERYPNYGGRGIKVCKEWAKFEQFYADIGPRPSPKHSIGRIDNDGDYCKENCRWENQEQQKFNTSKTALFEYEGVVKPVAKWASEYGISVDTLRQRIRAGIKTPYLFASESLRKKCITIDGVTKMTTKWMKDAQIPISSFYYWQRKGLSKEGIVRKYLTNEEKGHGKSDSSS